MGQTIGVNVARRAYDLDISQQFDGYSGVRIYVGTDDEGNDIIYEAGDTTGRTLELQNDFGTQQMANNILADIRGYQYQPMTANGALLDPAAEMGDGVAVNGVYSGIFVRATTFGRLMSADIAAPTDEEIAHEYSADPANTDRAYSRFVKSTRAAITMNASQIQAEVVRATTAEENLSARVTINADSITAEVTRATGAESTLSTRITQNANSITAEVTRATKAEGTLSATITATATEIKSTVAASGVWDSNGYNISINGYGTPSANKIAASAHRNQYYLDKTTGRLWYSNGSTWSGGQYLTSIQSSLHQTAESISAQVTAQGNTKLDKTFTSSSFGWNLNSTSFSLNANNSQNIFYADKTGIKIRGNAEVTGKITATSGYIGNGSSGFTIGTRAIWNGKSSLTSEQDGIYIGTDGISLGKNRFKVLSSGALTATSGTIGGFTIGTTSIYKDKTSMYSSAEGVYIGADGISLGRNTFSVTRAGALSATSGAIGGFTIGETKLYSGKSSIYADSDGIYLGYDGISLGGKDADRNNKFYVDRTGNLHATSATISGNVKITSGSISIGGNFNVDSQGNLTANSGTFLGEVRAANIQHATWNPSSQTWSNPEWGTFDGGAIAGGSIEGRSIEPYTITGGSGGNIADYTVDYSNTGFTGTLDQVGINASDISALSSEIATIQAGYFNSISTSSILFGDYSLYVASDGVVHGSYVG